MTYVDEAIWPFRNMMMCHLVADTEEELHEMARKLGMKRAWFQNKSSLPHYDLCKSKRAQAVKLGAREISRREIVEMIRKEREKKMVQQEMKL